MVLSDITYYNRVINKIMHLSVSYDCITGRVIVAYLMTSTTMQLSDIKRLGFDPLPSWISRSHPYKWRVDVEIRVVISRFIMVRYGVYGFFISTVIGVNNKVVIDVVMHIHVSLHNICTCMLAWRAIHFPFTT